MKTLNITIVHNNKRI